VASGSANSVTGYVMLG